MSVQDDQARYMAAAHAVQSAIAVYLNRKWGVDDDTPIGNLLKHLRVGIDSAKAEQGALARLLVAKGVITEDEYVAAMADAMEAEKQSYTDLVRQLVGHDGIDFA
jgi:hypothetical protein